MRYFLFKLIPPRPTFARDMTDTEAKLMQEHVAYWKELMERGLVIVFGPVADPKGTYGIAILEAGEKVDIKALGLNDPTMKANAGFQFEVYPMAQAILRGCDEST